MRQNTLRSITTISVAVTLLASCCANAVPLTLAAYPDASQDKIVFVYRDAIWVAPVTGGQARLLSDIGERPRHPKFSPDGQSVAYSTTVDDNVDVYVVPLSGGTARRLTHHPARDDMIDWYPDGESILYKSTMQSPRPVYNRLFHIDADGGLPQALPLPYGETAAISADQQEILFTYLRDFQEEVWKRYLGGRAPDIWTYDARSGKTERLTDHPAPDSVPMIFGSQVYFLSERGPEMRSNLWRKDRRDGNLDQLTHFAEADVRNPSIGEAGIVFEVDGNIHLLDMESGQSAPIPIDLAIARDERVPRRQSVAKLVESVDVGYGEHIIIQARGDVFLYDIDDDIATNLTNTSDAAERYPSLSPDGTRVAYFSDRSGEYQLTILDLETSKEQRLSDFESGFRYRPQWSPDGNFLVFMDQQQTLWLVDSRNGKMMAVDEGQWRYHWDMPQFRVSWSANSQWFAYTTGDDNRNQVIHVYDTRARKKHRLTSGFYSDFEPVFDPSGNYLAMLSYRHFSPTLGDIDATFTYTDSMVVSLLALTDGIRLPGTPGWEMPEKNDKFAIDPADAEARLKILSLPPGRYFNLAFQDAAITVMKAGEERGSVEFLRLALDTDEPETIWEGSIEQVYDTRDDRTAIKTTDGELLLLTAEEDNEGTQVQTEKLSAVVDRGAEYLQMFDDSWRYQRDFYYDPGLHGVDWNAVREHYRPLAAAAHSDQELTAIIREMHGELAAGHVYVSTEPPYNRGDATDVGLLGADFAVRDGAYVISRILRPGIRRFEHRSPLDEPGLDVSEGDFLLAVNGIPINTDTDPWEAFAGLADQLVELTIADDVTGRNSRKIRVKTLASERKLRELAWVEETRKYVDTASDGQIGYIYVPNTGAEGQNELMQMYRAQYNRKALIIDERFNTGGALGDRLIELLNRPPLNYFSSRNASDYPLPELAHRGPKAMLINSWSYSGGDGFPFLFKEAGVGPLIGTRTWGGLIGPGMRMSLINGGFISAPPQRVYDTRGQWAEGNEGVRPDVPLLNNPGILASGRDQQLEHAIRLLLGEIEDLKPVVVPEFPEKTPVPEILE